MDKADKAEGCGGCARVTIRAEDMVPASELHAAEAALDTLRAEINVMKRTTPLSLTGVLPLNLICRCLRCYEGRSQSEE